MSIKIIIANNNDILFNNLSNIALENESKIEIINVPTDKLDNLIYQIKPRENLIVLDSITSVSFCINLLKNAINRVIKGNIIILVIDSKHIKGINCKGVRSAMDKSLNNMLDNTDIKIFYEIFEDYDGRKISLKYFIDLCIRFLEKQRYCCLEN